MQFEYTCLTQLIEYGVKDEADACPNARFHLKYISESRVLDALDIVRPKLHL